jgi:predicted HicB family RNase H-like nuclease
LKFGLKKLFLWVVLLTLNKSRKKAAMSNHKYSNYFQTSYDRETYQAIRKVSMQKGISMQDVVREAVSKYLDEDIEPNNNENESDERTSKYVSKRKSYFK